MGLPAVPPTMARMAMAPAPWIRATKLHLPKVAPIVTHVVIMDVATTAKGGDATPLTGDLEIAHAPGHLSTGNNAIEIRAVIDLVAATIEAATTTVTTTAEATIPLPIEAAMTAESLRSGPKHVMGPTIPALGGALPTPEMIYKK